MAVGPQTPEQAKSMNLPFPVLSDPDLRETAKYGLVHAKGMLGRDVPRPTTLLLAKDTRKILWIRPAENIRIRPTPDEIFAQMREHLGP